MAWLTEVCRLCLAQDSPMLPIFNEDYYKQLSGSLHLKISSVADLQLNPGDGLPVLVCEDCCQQVEVSYEFRLRCHQSDTQLRQFVDDPPLEIMNAPDVKQEIEIVENGLEMEFPEEVDINEDVSSEDSCAGEFHNPDPLGVDPLSGATIRLKSEFALIAAQQNANSIEVVSTNLNNCRRAQIVQHNNQHHEGKVGEAPFLHDTDPSYMLAFDESSGLTMDNSVDETGGYQKEPVFNCFLCPARYLKKNYFLNHLKKHIKKNQQDGDTDPEVNERLHVNINHLSCQADEPQKEVPVTNYVCEICNSSYTAQRNYLKHLKFIHSIDKKPQNNTDITEVEVSNEINDDVPHSECIAQLKNLIEIDPELDPQVCACIICKSKFQTLSELVDHNLNIHSSKEISKCSFCKRKFFTLISFMKHFKVHTVEKKFSCLDCRAKFVSENHLKLHTTVTHNRDCPICGKPLKRKADLSAHIKTHDPPRPEGTIIKRRKRKSYPESEFNIENQRESGGHEFTIVTASDAGRCEPEPVASTSSEKPRPRMSKIEGSLKTKNYYSQVYQTCLRKQFSIKNGAKHSPKKKKIKKMLGHKLSPSKEVTKIVFGHKAKNHKGMTQDKFERKITIKMGKNGPKMIKTEKQPKIVMSENTMPKKEKRKKMIKSENMLKIIKTEPNLYHKVIKTEFVPKVGKKEKHKSSKMAPTELNQRSYLTEVSVENQARAEENIRIAKLSRKNECLFCAKLFMGISKLKRHILIHTGERPFECEICLRRFNQKPSLKMHIMVCHTTKKPYPCSQCSQAFTRQYMLLNHMEKHHNM